MSSQRVSCQGMNRLSVVPDDKSEDDKIELRLLMLLFFSSSGLFCTYTIFADIRHSQNLTLGVHTTF